MNGTESLQTFILKKQFKCLKKTVKMFKKKQINKKTLINVYI